MKKRRVLVSMLLLIALMLAGCSVKTTEQTDEKQVPVVGNLKYDYSMELKYAKKFTVDYFKGGYALISINNGSRFLVVPENKEVPQDLDEDIAIIQQPISNIYLVAPAAMPFFVELDSIDRIRLSGTRVDAWSIPEAVREMEAGNILFAGKYSEPDFELLLAENCKLTIQSNMISHAPQIKEKLEEIGLTVLVELSSYEDHPLGRTEWIKMYSVLFDKEELGEKIFNEQASVLDELKGIENTEKTVAFFYITTQNTISARNTNDYVPKMIEIAGGRYIFKNLGDPAKALSTTKMGMEEFYGTAKEADIIIYNSTINGGLNSIKELVDKNELFANFKAVKEGNVWCTGQDFYQNTNEAGSIIKELRTIILNDAESFSNLKYFYKLQ